MRHSWGLVLIAAVIGCGRGETNEQRLKRLVPDAPRTTKVSGVVTVDGAPVKDLWVRLHPTSKSTTHRPRAQTDEYGRFRITTFFDGDGAPAGDYDLTIEWLTFTRVGTPRWTGPDKLHDQYNDPQTTPFQVTVDEIPLTLPPFELALQGVQAKPKK